MQLDTLSKTDKKKKISLIYRKLHSYMLTRDKGFFSFNLMIMKVPSYILRKTKIISMMYCTRKVSGYCVRECLL